MGKPKKAAKKKSRGAGPLLIMAILFLSSGAVRVAANLTASSAETAAQAEESGFVEQCQQEPHIEELLSRIKTRQARLVVQDREIEDRMHALHIAEVELQKTLEIVEAAEAKLQSSLSLAATAMNDDLARLVAVYENMKPQDAAALFESMPPEFAAGFLAPMRSEVAAEIMAALPPDFAYGISVFIAGRNAGLQGTE